MKHFIAGFCLSLFSMSLSGQLYSSASADKLREPPKGDIKIDLFKAPSAIATPTKNNLFAEIKKQSINSEDKANQLLSEQKNTVFEEVNGIEDDEILRVNVDDIIPIDFIDNDNSQQAEVLYQADDDLVAMLPEDTYTTPDSFTDESPWVIAKGAKNIKNKRLAEQLNKDGKKLLLTDDFADKKEKDKEISHKVAEKIKQSIIFPIPNEILNDENLTPTFISGDNGNKKKIEKNTKKNTVEPATSSTTDSLKIVNKVPTQNTSAKEENSSILNSISSWFSTKPEDTVAPQKTQSRPAPSYSSQGQSGSTQKGTIGSTEETDEFVKFYETLQQTTRAHEENRIVPAELKLSFQPGRAEISGQTLRWLKTFSDSTKDGSTYLEVKLDPSTPMDLQKKRLSLLYTIFMNNGVDLNLIDTVFSLNEPNAFIIRTLKRK